MHACHATKMSCVYFSLLMLKFDRNTLGVFDNILLCYSCRHKSEEEEEVDGPTGSLRINGSQIETKIQYVSVSLNPTTSVEEVLKEAIKQFSTQVTFTTSLIEALCYDR